MTNRVFGSLLTTFGSTTAVPAITPDITATMVDLTGVCAAPGQPLDGWLAAVEAQLTARNPAADPARDQPRPSREGARDEPVATLLPSDRQRAGPGFLSPP